MKLELFQNIKVNANLIFLLFILLNISCIQQRKEVLEYYPDGQLKSKYYINDDSIVDGSRVVFYPSGNVYYKENYASGKNIDSIVFFRDKKNSLPSEIQIIEKDNSIYVKNFTTSGELEEEGFYTKDNLRIGIWKFYANNHIKYIKEFKVIRDTEYTNQLWNLLPNGDTLTTGSSLKYSISNTKITLGDSIQFLFQSAVPTFSMNSSDFVITIPKEFQEQNFNPDFSNYELTSEKEGIQTIQHYSLSYDSLHKSEKMSIPKTLHNKTIVFDIKPLKTGIDTLRGWFEEFKTVKNYSNIHNIPWFNLQNTNQLDTIEYQSRKIYFDIPIEVVE